MSSRIKFSDHTKRAKRRMLEVANARSMADRVPIYRELVEITRWTMGYAAKAVSVLKTLSDLSAWAAAELLDHYLERRAFQEESVPEPQAWSSTCCWSAVIPPTPLDTNPSSESSALSNFSETARRKVHSGTATSSSLGRALRACG